MTNDSNKVAGLWATLSAAVFLFTSFATSAVEPDVLTDSFTSIRILNLYQFNSLDGSPNNLQSIETNIGSSTNHSALLIAGEDGSGGSDITHFVDGAGRAGADFLGAKVRTDGVKVFEARVQALTHDIYTILGSQPVGTAGSLRFVYRVSGEAFFDLDRDALDNALNVFISPNRALVAANMRARVWAPDGNGGAMLDGFDSFGGNLVTVGDLLPCGAPCAVTGPFLPQSGGVDIELDVPFVYGEPLPLSIDFWLRVFPDVTCGTVLCNNYFSEEITADFNNTAKLVAIVTDDLTTTIATASGFELHVSGDRHDSRTCPGARCGLAHGQRDARLSRHAPSSNLIANRPPSARVAA